MCKPYLFTRFSFARLYCSPTNGMSAMKKNRRPPHWDLFRSVSDQFFSCQNSSGNWLPSSQNTQPAAVAAVQLQGKNGVVLLSGKVWKEQIDGCHYSLTFASRLSSSNEGTVVDCTYVCSTSCTTTELQTWTCSMSVCTTYSVDRQWRLESIQIQIHILSLSLKSKGMDRLNKGVWIDSRHQYTVCTEVLLLRTSFRWSCSPLLSHIYVL